MARTTEECTYCEDLRLELDDARDCEKYLREALKMCAEDIAAGAKERFKLEQELTLERARASVLRAACDYVTRFPCVGSPRCSDDPETECGVCAAKRALVSSAKLV